MLSLELDYLKKVMKYLAQCLSIAQALPTVIWHGMGDYGESSGMKRMADLILQHTDNDYVLNLAIGNCKWDLKVQI